MYRLFFNSIKPFTKMNRVEGRVLLRELRSHQGCDFIRLFALFDFTFFRGYFIRRQSTVWEYR
jgi:hypothetical protein